MLALKMKRFFGFFYESDQNSLAVSLRHVWEKMRCVKKGSTKGTYAQSLVSCNRKAETQKSPSLPPGRVQASVGAQGTFFRLFGNGT